MGIKPSKQRGIRAACSGRHSGCLSEAMTVYKNGRRACLRLLPLDKYEAKISQIQALPSCAADIIWSQRLQHSSDWRVEPRYRGAAHTTARLNCGHTQSCQSRHDSHFLWHRITN